MLLGAGFVVEDTALGWVKGHAEWDGYVGWVEARNLAANMADEPTHRVTAIRSYAKRAPGLKDTSERIDLSFGSEVSVLSDEEGWSAVRVSEFGGTGYMPSVHLTPISHSFTDTVTVAQMLLGTPYLWGGNSAFGIDCSGLVQAALHACGMACPGDSGPQERHFP